MTRPVRVKSSIFTRDIFTEGTAGDLSPSGALIWLAIFRIILGIGVGGDYPMSASITSDRSSMRRRGTMLAYIFSFQGWGSLVGALATMVVLACYKSTMEAGHTSKVDGVWRIVIGLSLIPALGTLYQRLTLPESEHFKESQRQHAHEDDIEDLKKKADADVASADSATHEKNPSVTEEAPVSPTPKAASIVDSKKNHWKGM